MNRRALLAGALLTPLAACATPARAQETEVAPPTAVVIPVIGVCSTLMPLFTRADGEVQVPPVETPEQAGWFAYGPRPGEPGAAVVLGHVDGGGQRGVFYDLHRLSPGDEVIVHRADRTTARFTATWVEQIPKDEFVGDEFYRGGPEPELRLVTCGGLFLRDQLSYSDNVLVYAA